MSTTPQLSKVDSLHGIIYFSEWYCKHKYVRQCSAYSFFYAIYYLCGLSYNSFANSELVTEFDILIGMLAIEVILANLSLSDERLQLEAIFSLRERCFWKNDCLTPHEKRTCERDMKSFVYLHFLVWFFLFLLTVLVALIMSFPKFVYNSEWPFYLIVIAQLLFLWFHITGYYLGTTHVCYYSYVILHGYYQMKVLIGYLRVEFEKQKKRKMKDKVYCEKYQAISENILIRCIKQHQELTNYGTKTSVMYRRWMLWHFTIAIAALSLGFHCFVFDSNCNKFVLLVGIAHFDLCCLLYIGTGQLFSEAYIDFHKALLNLNWYTLNRNNRKLYYMFVMFTQKEFGIEVLPSLTLTRPVVTSFLKTIYGGITLLRSVQKK